MSRRTGVFLGFAAEIADMLELDRARVDIYSRIQSSALSRAPAISSHQRLHANSFGRSLHIRSFVAATLLVVECSQWQAFYCRRPPCRGSRAPPSLAMRPLLPALPSAASLSPLRGSPLGSWTLPTVSGSWTQPGDAHRSRNPELNSNIAMWLRPLRFGQKVGHLVG
jgi:hypothetical protein